MALSSRIHYTHEHITVKSTCPRACQPRPRFDPCVLEDARGRKNAVVHDSPILEELYGRLSLLYPTHVRQCPKNRLETPGRRPDCLSQRNQSQSAHRGSRESDSRPEQPVNEVAPVPSGRLERSPYRPARLVQTSLFRRLQP